MEGRTRITLMAPGTDFRNAFGEVFSSAVEHERRAAVHDRKHESSGRAGPEAAVAGEKSKLAQSRRTAAT